MFEREAHRLLKTTCWRAITAMVLAGSCVKLLPALDRDLSTLHYLHVAWTQTEGSALPSVQAIAQKLKVEQHNKVDDDATILLEYPDATVIIEASWDWPHSMGQVQVFGPKGSLLATHDALFYRSTEDRGKSGLEGEPVALSGAQAATNNPVAYFVDCIRHDKPIEEPLSAQLNVQVLEILDAARESVRTGRVQELR